jgi:ADP-ribose pyrophosphatase YjhB (NUDIX family)
MECRVHKLIADVAVLAEGHVLLVKYRDVKKYDGQRGWFLPDDFLEHEEHPDDAAQRIVREQAGVDRPEVRLGLIESFGNGAWHLVFHYITEIEERATPRPGENVEQAEWFDVKNLPAPKEMAHHGWGRDVLQRMGVET